MSDLDFVHRFVQGAGENPNVLLLLHGTGGDESDLLPIGRKLNPNATLLSPRGKVSEDGALRFFRRFAEGIFDEEDVIRRAKELADFVAAAAANYGFGSDNVAAVGYSNGANIAAAMMLLHPTVLKSAVLLRAMVPLSQPAIPDLDGRDVLISSGRSDPIVPLENAQRLAALLKTAGADVTMRVQEASHSLVREDLRAAKDWLRK